MTNEQFEHTIEDMESGNATPEQVRAAARWMDEHPLKAWWE